MNIFIAIGILLVSLTVYMLGWMSGVEYGVKRMIERYGKPKDTNSDDFKFDKKGNSIP